MGKIYHLDLKTLIETLEGQSGILQRELPKGVGPSDEPLLCIIHLSRGALMNCTFITRNGQQSDGRSLLTALYELENWDVTLNTNSGSRNTTPLSPITPNRATASSADYTITPSSMPALNAGDLLIPYLLARLQESQLASLSHKDRLRVRMVYVQINGTRNVGEIRARLPLSAELVNHTLNLLFQNGVIHFRRA